MLIPILGTGVVLCVTSDFDTHVSKLVWMNHTTNAQEYLSDLRKY